MTAGAGAPRHDDDERSRIRLNVGLYVATVALACVAVFLGVLLRHDDVDVKFWTADFWSGEKASAERPGEGVDVGRGVVEAVDQAPESDQDRIGEQLAAATRLVDAFANLDHADPAASMDVVRSLATGDFQEQYDKGAAELEELAVKAKSTMVSAVVWSGLVAGDDDSATVIVATSGTVKNKTTKFEEESVNYRIQVQLVRDGDDWLANDLQFVELG
ncbi:hypothetical protein ACFQ0K_00285 [Nocardioides caeni]|uniref:Mce-associated membrane protein n=1 Tax=Nocardioides caeni TaxID=574700 RepID=A0A4S8NQD1_9ACTN|nr:hypothetical protein [Nocardioides caeni]THV18675.1 hypothetical protein E9934_03460 [Nocardioides caeni]